MLLKHARNSDKQMSSQKTIASREKDPASLFPAIASVQHNQKSSIGSQNTSELRRQR